MLSGTRLEGAPEGATNRLYKNNRDGTFTDVTEKAGLRTARAGSSAVTVGDFNNDGFDDLFITYWGQNVLYRNNGDGTFTDVTEKAGFVHAGQAMGLGLHVRRLRPRRPPGSVRRELSRTSIWPIHPQAGTERQLQLERRSGELRSARAAAGRRPRSITTTATARSRM